MIKDFFVWLKYICGKESQGYSWGGMPNVRSIQALSKIYKRPIVYREKKCPYCGNLFYDYTGRKACLRFRCFRRYNGQ